MGAVYVEVKLTNASDLDRVEWGGITADKVRTYRADALVDTGAVRSVIPHDVMQWLGLRESTRRFVRFADGHGEDVIVTTAVRFDIMGRTVTEEAFVLGDEVLIGQTTLEALDLWVDTREMRLVPNPQYPDRHVNRIG